MTWTLSEDFRDFPPPREVATHKGTYGHVAIVAGSVGFHGAAVLASRGAQRAQPGLITVHMMEDAYMPVATQLQAVMAAPWKSGIPYLKYSALLVGPGLAAEDLPKTLREEIIRLWRELPLPMIVDASALAWLPRGAVSTEHIRVITPHPGEATRMLATSTEKVQLGDRVASLRELSKGFGNCWVVLKGHETLVGRAEGNVYVNSSGNPHLAQGGSGDLLSGYLAGFLGQFALQQDPELAIRYAVWRHGSAADGLQEAGKNWVIEELAEAL
jgi:NAD(P)H-hydrate epimerase